MKLVAKILRLISNIITNIKLGINVYKTIYVNFRFLPFKQACKFPIWVYGKMKFGYKSGSIVIDAPVKRGMIIIGINRDRFMAPQGTFFMDIAGKMVFKGSVIMGRGCTLACQRTAVLILGKAVRISSFAKIRAYKRIDIGNFTAITSECQIFDTNFHYMRNLKTGEVAPISKEVIIGECCWVGNRTNIMRGTILPDNTIVSSNSLLNKDYTNSVPPYSILGGMPARLLKTDIARVYQWDLYGKLESHFSVTDEPYFAYTGIEDEASYIEKSMCI